MKRILALILAFILCLSTMTVAASVSLSSEQELPQDYLSMTNALVALGVVPEVQMSVDTYNKIVSRGEFAGFLINLINMDGTETSASFPDLPKSHSYYTQVACAAELELITPDKQGYIHPDAAITVGEATKAIVTLLGFSICAQSKGGTDWEYFTQARQLNLINRDCSPTDKLTFAATVQILYNSLLSDTAYSLPPQYSLIKSRSILESHYGLNVGSGLVTANRYYAISGKTTDGNGLIINGEYYRATEKVDINCVGLYVEFFYDENNTIVAVCPDKYEKLNISAKDIKGFSNNKYSYYKTNGKRATASVTSDSYILKNYKSVIGRTDMLPGDNGEVVLIDYNHDGIYEIVFINNYSEMVVSSVSEDNKSIVCKNGKTVEYEDADKVLVVIDGKIGSLADISKDSTISVCTSGKDEAVVIYVSYSKVEGTITMLGEDEVYIRGHMYPISSGFDKKNTLNLGEDGLFYLNHKGEVVYFDSQSSGIKFGYLIRTGIKAGLSGSALFKVLTADNEIKIFKGRETIVYNGSSSKSANVVEDIKTSGNQGSAEQIIRYKTNSNDEIYYIETALDSIPSTNEERLHLTAEMSNGNRGFEAKTAAGDKTIQFSVPSNPGSDDIFYKVVSSVKTEKTNFKAYNVKKYSIIADAIVGYTPGGGKNSGNGGGPAGDIDYDSHTAIITDIVYTLDSNEMFAKKVTLLQNTGWPLKVTELSFIVADNSAWETQQGNEADTVQNGDNLNVGDVILYQLNSSGEIGRINRIYNAAEKSIDSAHGGANPVTSNNGSFTSPLRLLESYAYKTEDTFIMVSSKPINSMEPDRSSLEVHDYQYENVIIVEKGRRGVAVRVGNISDIKTYENYGADCDKVLINTNWGTVRTVVAIRSDV